jgi:hypothetical protein
MTDADWVELYTEMILQFGNWQALALTAKIN